MKNLIYILLFITAFASAQEVTTTQKGLWKVFVDTTLVSSHTRQDKAVTKAINLVLAGENAYVLPFDRLDFEVVGIPQMPLYDSEIQDIDITVSSVKSTSANINITNNFDNVDYVYVEFYSNEKPKQQTTKGLINIYSAKELTPNTDYYFTVYFAMVDGTIKTSNILTFKTL